MRSALLVIDVQRALCEGEQASHAAQQTVERINQAAAAARAAGALVVFVQHETAAGPFARGSDTWQLAIGLGPQPGDPVVHKTTPDAFQRTGLKELLDAQERAMNQTREHLKTQEQALAQTRDQLRTQDQTRTQLRDQLMEQDKIQNQLLEQLKTQDQLQLQIRDQLRSQEQLQLKTLEQLKDQDRIQSRTRDELRKSM